MRRIDNNKMEATLPDWDTMTWTMAGIRDFLWQVPVISQSIMKELSKKIDILPLVFCLLGTCWKWFNFRLDWVKNDSERASHLTHISSIFETTLKPLFSFMKAISSLSVLGVRFCPISPGQWWVKSSPAKCLQLFRFALKHSWPMRVFPIPFTGLSLGLA